MLFSIVITTYGRALKIDRAIKSVLNQDYKEEYEIIVVDDNGKGTLNQLKTEEKVCKYDKVKYLIQEKNKGANAARNRGIIESKAEYICLLDDDDEFLENKLSCFKEIIFLENPDLIFSNANLIDVATKKTKSTEVPKSDNLKIEILKRNLIGSNSFVCLRKKRALEIGMFNENLRSCQDWDMWIRMIYNDAKVSFCKENLVNYYIDSSEKTRITNNFLNKHQGHLHIIELTKKYLENLPLIEKKEIEFAQNQKLKEISYESGEFKYYRKYFRENFIFSRVNYKEYIKYFFSFFKIKF